VTDFVCLDSFVPITEDTNDRVLTGHATITNGQPPGGPAVVVAGQATLLFVLLERGYAPGCAQSRL
jgi:hypothetical protein